MRTLASLVAALALAACDAPPPGEPPPDGVPITHELTLPAIHAASHELALYAELDGEQAIAVTELSYGLADGYPLRVEAVAESGFILGDECQPMPGEVVWRSIADVQGTAATLELDGGALAVELREEGTVTALLEGEVGGQQCTFGGGSTVTTVPLQHQIVLQVHRVAGFEVETFHQVLADCWEAVVLPADVLLRAPTAQPTDAAGQRFVALNAPTPATITLRSDGALTPADDVGYLLAGPGEVSVAVDTTLPVRGLESFVVVGPDALTAVEAALYLEKAAAKGTVVEQIEDGKAYELFFPEQRNTVEVRVDSAMTAHGRLCTNVPEAWFASSSSTPEQCAAGPGSPVKVPSAGVTVATMRAAGECRLEVTIPGTSHAWTTQFSTTH